MVKITCEQLQNALLDVCEDIISSEPMLTEIDVRIGDGDHGTGMKTGFSSVRELLLSKRFDTVSSLFRSAGMELIKTMGGASGVIFGSLFIGGYDTIDGKTELSLNDLADFFRASYSSILKRGKAKLGDKTMVDALDGAVSAFDEASLKGLDMVTALKMAADGAQKGAESTKQMLPRLGRSKNYRESALGYPDPGAVSTSIIFNSIYKSISKSILEEKNGTLQST